MISGFKRLVMFLILVLMANTVIADGIVVSNATAFLEGDVYLVDATLEFEFDEEVLQALQHGVAFNIDIEIRLRRERNWLWDPKVKEEILSLRLEQHPLSNRYIITNINTGNRQQFQSLHDALNRLGEIDNYFLVSQAVLSPDENYICMIRAELSTETVPAAIRPAALLSKKWQMDSPWFEWVLER